MKKKRKWLLLLLLFLLSAAAGLYAAAHSPEISGEAEAVQAADSEYIALTSRLTICSEYQLCGHVLEEEVEMPAASGGLSGGRCVGHLPDCCRQRRSGTGKTPGSFGGESLGGGAARSAAGKGILFHAGSQRICQSIARPGINRLRWKEKADFY